MVYYLLSINRNIEGNNEEDELVVVTFLDTLRVVALSQESE